MMKRLKRAEQEYRIDMSKSFYIAHTCLPQNSLGDYQSLGFNMHMEKPIKIKIIEKLIKKLNL